MGGKDSGIDGPESGEVPQTTNQHQRDNQNRPLNSFQRHFLCFFGKGTEKEIYKNKKKCHTTVLKAVSEMYVLSGDSSTASMKPSNWQRNGTLQKSAKCAQPFGLKLATQRARY
jgi:hypothetical protein